MYSVPGNKVIIVGCGIAGPVLAMFLQRKGYEPVLYDRLEGPITAGISLMLQPNGLKVLDLLGDIIPNIPGRKIEQMAFYSTRSDGDHVLVESDAPTHLPSMFGFGMIGVERTGFHKMLCETAAKRGIPIFWKMPLTDIKQEENSVTAIFKDGTTDSASFLVGCDGLHSNTRVSLFGEEQPTYTGLCQTGGLAPTPSLKVTPSMDNIFTPVGHMITYPISETHSSWGITQLSEEHKEDWRHTDEQFKTAFKAGPHATMSFGAGELVKNAERLVKYGLYDRPELSSWHKGRVVLLGDAAHPTTPHIGQGANQAFEDVYHLVLQLTKHDPTPNPDVHLSTSALEEIFSAYEKPRIVRTAAMVKEARSRGNVRAIIDESMAEQRDEGIKQNMSGGETMRKQYEIIANGPFLYGQSEI